MVKGFTLFKRMALILVVVLILVPLAAAYAQQPPQAVQDAVAALGQKLGRSLSLSDMANWTWEQKNFPDSSLGCPFPGQTYPQVATNGFIITLTYGGIIYDYRVSANRQLIFLCSPGGGAPGGTSTGGVVTGPTPIPTPTQNIPVIVPTNPVVIVPPSGAAACPGGVPTRLAAGMQAKSIATGSLNIRSQPGTTNPVAGLLLPDGQINIIGGPQCVSNQTWWNITYQTQSGVTTKGWIMEYDPTDGQYWLAPVGVTPSGGALPPVSGRTGISGIQRNPITSANAGQLRLVAEQPLGTQAARAVFWNNFNGDLLVIQVPGNAALWYNAMNGQQLRSVGQAGQNVLFAAWGPQSDQVARIVTIEKSPTLPTGSVMYFWDAPIGVTTAPTMVNGFQLPVMPNAVVASPNGRLVAISSGNRVTNDPNTPNAVWVFDMTTGAQVVTLSYTAAISDLAFSPDGSMLAGTIPNQGIMLWAVATQTPLGLIADPQVGIAGTSSLAFSPDGTLLAEGTTGGQIKLWTVGSRTLRNTITTAPNTYVPYLSFNSNGSVLAAASMMQGGFSGSVSLYDPNAGMAFFTLPPIAEQVAGVGFATSNSSTLVVVTATKWSIWSVY